MKRDNISNAIETSSFINLARTISTDGLPDHNKCFRKKKKRRIRTRLSIFYTYTYYNIENSIFIGWLVLHVKKKGENNLENSSFHSKSNAIVTTKTNKFWKKKVTRPIEDSLSPARVHSKKFTTSIKKKKKDLCSSWKFYSYSSAIEKEKTRQFNECKVRQLFRANLARGHLTVSFTNFRSLVRLYRKQRNASI